VDVFIHEMILPPELMAMKNLRLKEPQEYPGTDAWKDAVDTATTVIDSSHTPQGAFGYLLSRIEPRPRLAVAAHFPVADDTVACALNSVKAHCDWIQQLGKDPLPKGERGYITWAIDLMVLSVTKDEIKQMRGVVTNFAWPPFPRTSGELRPPKYWKWGVDENGRPVRVSDPRAQIDVSTVIEPGPRTWCEDGY
jgi:ribonuclease Z